MSVKQLSVFLENRPGALYGMTGILSQNKIDMRALSVAETRISASSASSWMTRTRRPLS